MRSLISARRPKHSVQGDLNINQSDLFADVQDESDGQLGTDGSKLPPIDQFISGKPFTPPTPSVHNQLHSTSYKSELGDAKRELLSDGNGSSSGGGSSGSDSARGSCSSARSCSSSSYSPDELSSSPTMHCSPALYPSSIPSTADCLPEVMAERSHLQPPIDASSSTEDGWTMAGGIKLGLLSSNRSSGTNQLGRTYSPGLPLSMLEREQIVELYKSGWKICDISKTLCIT